MADDFSNVTVEQWPIDNLVAYEKNHKKHPPAHIKALADSIAEFGVEHPIAIEADGTIISGHGRRLALIELGRKFAPVRVFHGITKEQAQKLRIAANKTTSNEYDTDILAHELRAILEADGTLDGIGLTEKEMTTLLDDIGEVDLGSMSDDIVADVEKHEGDVTAAAKKADEALVPVSKAFSDALGVKQIEAPIARLLPQFIGVLEKKHGKNAISSLVEHMTKVVDDAA